MICRGFLIKNIEFESTNKNNQIVLSFVEKWPK